MKLRRFSGITEAMAFVDGNKSIENRYVEDNLTAREIAGIYCIDFSDTRTERAFVKALSEKFPKAQWGGKRTGAGNKPGWRKK